jgi:hypothetical protein
MVTVTVAIVIAITIADTITVIGIVTHRWRLRRLESCDWPSSC